MATQVKPVPDGYHTLTPYLVVDGAERIVQFMKDAFGAQFVFEPMKRPDGKIMHAELRIGNSRFMLNDAMMGGKGPHALGGSPASFWIYVEDCDALFKRAVDAGAQVHGGGMGKMQDQFWGDRSGTVTDPHGYNWTIATRKEDLSHDEMERRGAEWMKQFSAQPTH